MNKLTAFRQQLHRAAELSGHEQHTAKIITDYLEGLKPDKLITGIGGHGIAAIFNGSIDGPRVMIRCDIDALPITETTDLPYRSENDGAAHKCGHDGHATIVTGLAEKLSANRPAKGSVLLLYQPSEENGKGAARVIADSKFKGIEPDIVFGLHNLPGYPLGDIIVRRGVFASASTGIRIKLTGKTSHAAEPESGVSPALAVAQLVQEISALPQFHTSLHESAQATIIHARIGREAFGTSPGDGEVAATLRSHEQHVIDNMTARAFSIAEGIAKTYGLALETETVEPFPSTVNDDELVTIIEESARAINLKVHHRDIPFPWSEDFGHFTQKYRGAFFGIGSGVDHPVLHHPDYDFPDALIEPGVAMFSHIIKQLLG
ncbi:MAG: amidohydrolase [Candidatus Zixiibacteriota bacterium]